MNETSIEWTDYSWNPVSGCRPVSSGCKNCYAKAIAERMAGTPAFPNGFKLTLRPHKLNEPSRIHPGSRVFVNSMSDLFWSEIPDDYRHKIFDVMEAHRNLTFQVLTKRAESMAAFSWDRPFPDNVQSGVTIEDIGTCERAEWLAQTNAKTRFISAEPLLEPIADELDAALNGSRVDWLIVGGESGRHISRSTDRSLAQKIPGLGWIPRTERVSWVTDLLKLSRRRDMAFFFKQWGGPRPKSAGSKLAGGYWKEYP